MADIIEATYSPVDLHTLLMEKDPKIGTLFASSKVGSIKDSIHLEPFETRGQWSFKAGAVPTSSQWWLSTSSSQGLAAGKHTLGRIKTSASHHAWWVHVNSAFLDSNQVAFGEYAIVQNSLNSDSVPSKNTIGPIVDGKHVNTGITGDREFEYIFDCYQAVADQIKADETQLAQDFCTAYDILLGGFTSLVRSIPHQKSSDSLWRSLWNRARQDAVYRAVVPSNEHLFNDPLAWTAQISSFFQEICDHARSRRGRALDDSVRIDEYFVAWADDRAWKADAINVNDGLSQTVDVAANTILVSISQPHRAGVPSSQVVNRATIGALPRAQRQVYELEEPAPTPTLPASDPASPPAPVIELVPGRLPSPPPGPGPSSLPGATPVPVTR